MSHELTTLPSGVTVVTEAMPSVRSVALGVWVAVGSRDEPEDRAGCSHFLEHLLFKGTTRRSARQIAEALDDVGGELNAFTSKEHTCFHARVLDRDVALAFDVLADMIVDARNARDDVEAERRVVLSELEIHRDTPDDIVHSTFAAMLLDQHPLARETLGTVDSVTALDRDVIDDFYRTYYRPGRLVVAAAGNTSHVEIVRLADTLLGDLSRPGEAAGQRHPPSSFACREVSLREKPTEQAHVVLGMPGLARQDEDRWALRVLDMLLGGGMSSRLFQEIRETRGLAYNTYSYATSYSDAGLFATYLGTSPARIDEALAVLREELDQVVEDVRAVEVDRARRALSGQLVLALEDTGSRMVRLGRQVVDGDQIVTVEEALANIDAVDLDAVRAVAGRVLGQPRVASIVGPFAPEERERFLSVVR